MENELITKLCELIENSSQAGKHIILSEVYLNDGELAESQKHTLKAVDILRTIVDDTFVEVLEEIGMENDNQTSELDSNALNLAYALSDISYNAGVLLGFLVNSEQDKVIVIAKTKLIHSINDAVWLYETLYA